MPSDVSCIFAQGWAMLPAIWTPLITNLKQQLADIPIQTFNPYAPKAYNSYPQAKHYVWIGHSFGFMQLWLNHTSLQLINKTGISVISIQGFTHLPEVGTKGSLARNQVQHMLRDLAIMPESTLKYFYRRAGLNPQQMRQHIAFFKQETMLNHLQAELITMQHTDIRESLLTNQPALLSLSATQDKIVTQELSRESFITTFTRNNTKKTLHPVTFKQIDSNSHCLPLSQPLWCTQAIIDFISGLPKS